MPRKFGAICSQKNAKIIYRYENVRCEIRENETLGQNEMDNEIRNGELNQPQIMAVQVPIETC